MLQSQTVHSAGQEICALHLQGQAATYAVLRRHPACLHLCSLLWSGSALRPQRLRPQRTSRTLPAVTPLSYSDACAAFSDLQGVQSAFAGTPMHCWLRSLRAGGN